MTLYSIVVGYKGKGSLPCAQYCLHSRSEPCHLRSRLFEEVRCFDPGGRSPWCGVTLTSLVAGGIWGLLLPTRHLSINDHFLSRPRVLGLSLDLQEMVSCLIYFKLWEGQGLNNAMTQQSVIRWARSKRPSSVLDVRVMEGKQCLRDSRDVLEAIGRDALEEDGRDLLQSHPVILPLLLSRINSMNIVRAIVWCIGTYNEI